MATSVIAKAGAPERTAAKSYPERLAQWVNQPARKFRDRHLVTFMAVRNDVQAALDAGFAAKTIWANMHETGRVDFCYETFLKHVKRCFHSPPGHQAAHAAKTKGKAVAEPVVVAAPTMPGFTFNPVPDKEELL
jgi:hypothetical protein